MIAAFFVSCIAFVFALIATLSFFSGQGDTGLVMLAGAWLLIWWSHHKLKNSR